MATQHNAHDEITGRPCIHIQDDNTGSVIQVHDDGLTLRVSVVEIARLGPLCLTLPADIRLSRGQVHDLLAYFKAVL